jgi:protocatechuate 3,4-dioxygenase beta subunit
VAADITLLRGGERLVGRARHAAGRPFQGSIAARRVADAADYLTMTSVTTDAEGKFTLEGLVAGPYFVTAYVPGRFAAQSRIVVVPSAAELALVVDAGLGPHAGRVVADADGKPLAGAQVEVLLGSVLGLSSVASRAVTDGDGRFDVSIAAGAVEYRVDAHGYEPLRLNRARPLEAPVELRMRRTARVQGRATREPDGAPVAGVPVFARSEEGPLQGAAVTDAQGRFEIAAVSPGPLTVFAHGAGFTTKGLSSWRFGDGFNPFEVNVEPDAVVNVDLVLVRAGVVKGKVVDAAGGAVAGATITPERLEPGGDHDPLAFLGGAAAVATDETGAFQLDTLLLDTSYRFHPVAGPSPGARARCASRRAASARSRSGSRRRAQASSAASSPTSAPSRAPWCTPTNRWRAAGTSAAWMRRPPTARFGSRRCRRGRSTSTRSAPGTGPRATTRRRSARTTRTRPSSRTRSSSSSRRRSRASCGGRAASRRGACRSRPGRTAGRRRRGSATTARSPSRTWTRRDSA